MSTKIIIIFKKENYYVYFINITIDTIKYKKGCLTTTLRQPLLYSVAFILLF